MIAYAMVLITDRADVLKAKTIDVQYGTKEYQICGDMMRAFIRATSHSYYEYPHEDCLAYGLNLVPPMLQPIIGYLYETLKETIIWNEQENV